MNLSGIHKGGEQLRRDLNVLTDKFHNASGRNERIKLLSTMTAIIEELYRQYNYSFSIPTA
jgi:hypothetical protein